MAVQTGDLITGNYADKKYYCAQGFTNSLRESFTAPGTTPTGCDFDSDDNFISVAYGTGKAYKHQGFSATIDTEISLAAASILQGCAMDDSDNLIALHGGAVDLIRFYAGFTDTIDSSYATFSADCRGISVYLDVLYEVDNTNTKLKIHVGLTDAIADDFGITDIIGTKRGVSAKLAAEIYIGAQSNVGKFLNKVFDSQLNALGADGGQWGVHLKKAEEAPPPPPPPPPKAGANRDFCNPRARSGFHCFVGQFCKNRNRHATPWRTPDAVLYTG